MTQYEIAEAAFGLFLLAHQEQAAAHAAAIEARERVEATRSGHASAIASFAAAAACYEQATVACERASADCSAAFAASRASTR